MMIMAVCDLPDYSGFIHSYIRSCCKLSTASGLILLVSKMNVGKRLCVVIVIKQHEQWDLWFTSVFLDNCLMIYSMNVDSDAFLWCFAGLWGKVSSASQLVSVSFKLFFLIVVSPHVWDFRGKNFFEESFYFIDLISKLDRRKTSVNWRVRV